MSLWRELKANVKQKEPLCGHTTFHIGGSAEWFIEPSSVAALRAVLLQLNRLGLEFKILGSGSNVLATDRSMKCAVIHLSRGFSRVSLSGNRVRAGAGAGLGHLVNRCVQSGLSGLEFLAGIPGSVGGALVMNAGVRQLSGKGYLSIGDLLASVTVMDRFAEVKTLPREKVKFSYRSSDLRGKIILGAEFSLRHTGSRKVKECVGKYLEHRLATQDTRSFSAGCVFKNPAGDSAGRLIDACGFKGRAVGGARVSGNHANFIVNTGAASCADVLKLMSMIKRGVKSKFGVTLEPEIEIWK